MDTKIKTAIAGDGAGYGLKCAVVEYLKENGIPYIDFGTDSSASVDYPVYAKKVAEAVLSGECGRGILICGTGIGISIAANRHRGIRAALCHDVFSAKATRSHNDANILAMGGRVIGAGLAVEVVSAFLNTPFSGEERHVKRIGMIESE
jgi:ribose 5-phosphate isomerase B